MAKLYGHSHGKARSHKPLNLKPEWMKINAKEAEQIVIQLAQKGVGEAKIGLILRDGYGIPSTKAITGKTIKQILQENIEEMKTKVPYDLFNLIKNLKKLKKHFETNKKDMSAKRGIQLCEAKIRRLQKYYKKRKTLPENWDHRDVKV